MSSWSAICSRSRVAQEGWGFIRRWRPGLTHWFRSSRTAASTSIRPSLTGPHPDRIELESPKPRRELRPVRDGRRRQQYPAVTGAQGSDGQPAWTPDGTRLVFTGTRNGVPQIYIMPADSADAEPVPLTTSAGGNQHPAVSPDGRTVAFVSIRDGAPRIYRMALDGSGQARATTGILREVSPEFFPNGDLVFGVERRRGPVNGGSCGCRAAPLR